MVAFFWMLAKFCSQNNFSSHWVCRKDFFVVKKCSQATIFWVCDQKKNLWWISVLFFPREHQKCPWTPFFGRCSRVLFLVHGHFLVKVHGQEGSFTGTFLDVFTDTLVCVHGHSFGNFHGHFSQFTGTFSQKVPKKHKILMFTGSFHRFTDTFFWKCSRAKFSFTGTFLTVHGHFRGSRARFFPSVHGQKQNVHGHFCGIVHGHFFNVHGEKKHCQYTVFRGRRITFFPANRVENQNEPKRRLGRRRLGSFWFSTRPTAVGGTHYDLHHALKSHQCLPLP